MAATAYGILLLFFGGPAAAGLPGRGEGYDENTEVTITGTIKEVSREAPGPVIVKVASRGRTYDVCTGPPWFLHRQHVSLQEGTEVEVTGSKMLSRDGTLLLILRRLKDINTGREVFFRDDFLRPLWRGRRHWRGDTDERPVGRF